MQFETYDGKRYIIRGCPQYEFFSSAKDIKAFYYEKTKGQIFDTVEKNDKKADDEFVKFLMSKEGHDHYKQIQVLISQHEIGLTAPAGTME